MIVSVGQPVRAHATSGSVAGTWGTGQTRAIGNLLLAVVSAAATTSVTASANAAGWTKQAETLNTASGPHVLVSVWTLPATGGDAAPTFTTTVTGTGAMDCMMFELRGALTAGTIVDLSATYASGAVAGTLSEMAAESTGRVAAAGEFAVSVFAQQRTAGNLTWTDTGQYPPFTKLLNGGESVSSTLQTYIGVQQPTPWVAIQDSGSFSTNTTAFGAGMIVVVRQAANPFIVPTFTNNAAATVSTGGTTTPASGTSETWSAVVVTSPFPSASPTAAPATSFLVIDPALPAEKILVTSGSGAAGTQSWTVTRGAEGTTPVSHTAGFSIVESVTAGVLTTLAQVDWLQYSLANFGADPTGTNFADAAMAAAQAALGNNPGIIILSPGATYKFANSYLFQPGQGMICPSLSPSSCLVYYTGSTNFITIRNPGFDATTGIVLGPDVGGRFSGFTIDGTLAGAGACAIEAGDIEAPQIDLTIQNFSGATAIGVVFNNRLGWTQNGVVKLMMNNNTTNVLFTCTPPTGGQSMNAYDFDLSVTLLPGQTGARWTNGAYQIGGRFALKGECGGAAGSNTGKVLDLGPDSNGGGLQQCEVRIVCECNWITGDVGPIPINRIGGATLMNCWGMLRFSTYGGSFQQCVGCWPGQWQFSFFGYMQADTAGDPLGQPPVAGQGFAVTGGTLWTGAVITSGTDLYLASADFFSCTLANGANTWGVVAKTPGRAQKVRWHVKQPSSGAAATLVLTGAITPSGGGAITLSSASNALDIVEVWTLDGVTVYAMRVGADLKA